MCVIFIQHFIGYILPHVKMKVSCFAQRIIFKNRRKGSGWQHVPFHHSVHIPLMSAQPPGSVEFVFSLVSAKLPRNQYNV